MEQTPVRSRESIWSVLAGWQNYYWGMFSVQFAACIILVTRHEVWVRDQDSLVDTLTAIGQRMAPITLVIAAQTIVVVEIMVMISEVFLEWRYKRGLARGLAQGLAQGREENRDQIEALQRRIEELEAAEEWRITATSKAQATTPVQAGLRRYSLLTTAYSPEGDNGI